MFDNLGEVRAKYERSLAEYQRKRTRVIADHDAIGFLRGLGLLLFVTMLGLLKIVAGLRLWLPAVGPRPAA